MLDVRHLLSNGKLSFSCSCIHNFSLLGEDAIELKIFIQQKLIFTALRLNIYEIYELVENDDLEVWGTSFLHLFLRWENMVDWINYLPFLCPFCWFIHFDFVLEYILEDVISALFQGIFVIRNWSVKNAFILWNFWNPFWDWFWKLLWIGFFVNVQRIVIGFFIRLVDFFY